MKDQIKTLLLYANGSKWSAVAIDTLLRGLLNLRPEQLVPESWLKRYWVNKLIGRRYSMASYMDDWIEAFSGAPELDVELCNISNLVEYNRHRKHIAEYPLIIVTHSAIGDNMGLLN